VEQDKEHWKSNTSPKQLVIRDKDVPKRRITRSTIAINQDPEQVTETYEAPVEYKERNNMEDEIEESHWETKTIKGALAHIYQKELEENEDNECQGEIQNNTLDAVKHQEIDEAENNMLFSSPKDRKEIAVSRTESQEAQQLKNVILPEVNSTTLTIDGTRRFSKFWQTPNEHPCSPFSPVEVQSQSWNDGKSPVVSIAKDF
jgi:hypothetical protein